jgi:hypothetical protein
MDLLKNSNSKEIQEMAITGISAVVLAAEEHIEPFYHVSKYLLCQ